MRQLNSEIEQYRVQSGVMGSDSSYGNNGMFRIPVGSVMLTVMASDGLGWQHVSVSTNFRTPTWEEMNEIKNIFWNEEETVIQFHPAKSSYVNCHQYCLHLWKKIRHKYELPPKELVG